MKKILAVAVLTFLAGTCFADQQTQQAPQPTAADNTKFCYTAGQVFSQGDRHPNVQGLVCAYSKRQQRMLWVDAGSAMYNNYMVD